MAKTSTQLIARVLGILQKLDGAAGETPSVEDSARVATMIEPKAAELGRRNIIYIGDTDYIADEAFHWFAILIAQDVAHDFGAQADFNQIALAESRLKELRGSERGGVVRAEYY